MATSPTTKVSLKLFIEKGSQRRVLFAEADKEFVDFLFSIFTLPVGTVTRLLKEGSGMVGSLPSLYKSIENMSVNHIQPAKDKSFLLQPKVFMPGAKLPLLLPNVASTFRQLYYKCSRSSPNVSSSPVSVLSSSSPAFGCSSTPASVLSSSGPAFGCSSTPAFGCSSTPAFGCSSTPAFGCSSNLAFGCSSRPAFGCSSSSCSSNLTDDDNTHCTCGCKNNVLATLTVKGPPGAIETFSTSEEGYVRETVTYMVMDDLEVKPLSTNSLVTLLSQFNVNDIRDVEEKVVDVGMDEGVKLLQASLSSKTVLTDIFLPTEITRTDDSINCEGNADVWGEYE